MKALVFAVGLFASGVATAAAPFCVVTSYGQNCWYYNADDCRRDAAQQNGMCAVNQEAQQSQQQQQQQVQIRTVGAPFCVVDATGSRCWYYTADECYRAAAQANGACVINPNR